MRRLGVRLAGIVAITLLVAGCGGDGNANEGNGGSSGGSGVTVSGTEFAYTPATVSVPAGAAVSVTLENRGVVEHDVTIDDLGFQLHADPGEANSATLTAPAGTYEFYCSIPGHREAGMRGTLTAG